jgi:hypothetical protein
VRAAGVDPKISLLDGSFADALSLSFMGCLRRRCRQVEFMDVVNGLWDLIFLRLLAQKDSACLRGSRADKAFRALWREMRLGLELLPSQSAQTGLGPEVRRSARSGHRTCSRRMARLRSGFDFRSVHLRCSFTMYLLRSAQDTETIRQHHHGGQGQVGPRSGAPLCRTMGEA